MENQTNPTNPSGPNVDSPVPPWEHYEIFKYAETEVLEELDKRQAGVDTEEFLVGLAVGYLYIPPDGGDGQRYSMSFGYEVDCDERSEEDELWTDPIQEQGRKDPLGDIFITKLYDDVRDKILESAPGTNGTYLVSLEITTGHCSKFNVICRGCRCGICATHGENIQRKRNRTTTTCRWVCTGSPCP